MWDELGVISANKEGDFKTIWSALSGDGQTLTESEFTAFFAASAKGKNFGLTTSCT